MSTVHLEFGTETMEYAVCFMIYFRICHKGKIILGTIPFGVVYAMLSVIY